MKDDDEIKRQLARGIALFLLSDLVIDEGSTVLKSLFDRALIFLVYSLASAGHEFQWEDLLPALNRVFYGFMESWGDRPLTRKFCDDLATALFDCAIALALPIKVASSEPDSFLSSDGFWCGWQAEAPSEDFPFLPQGDR